MICLPVFSQNVLKNKERENVSSVKRVGYRFVLKHNTMPE